MSSRYDKFCLDCATVIPPYGHFRCGPCHATWLFTRYTDARPFEVIVAESRAGRTAEECHPWVGTVLEDGYASRAAHRTLWIAEGRPDPGENHLEHTCHTADPRCPGGPRCLHRRCINLDHLMIVTKAENQALRRARNLAGKAA